LGNGNTVGVIPYAVGGGISFLTGIIGFASDQILAAKIITADGRAIKGAGQFFGVVLELTLKTYPLSLVGIPSGAHWIGRFAYSLDKAEEVGNALERLMVTTKHNTSGVVMVMAPPPAFQPMLAVAAHFIGDPKEAPAAFQSLSDLGPLMQSLWTMFVQKETSSALAWQALPSLKRRICSKSLRSSKNFFLLARMRVPRVMPSNGTLECRHVHCRIQHSVIKR
jgi:hypothetical protein